MEGWTFPTHTHIPHEFQWRKWDVHHICTSIWYNKPISVHYYNVLKLNTTLVWIDWTFINVNGSILWGVDAWTTVRHGWVAKVISADVCFWHWLQQLFVAVSFSRDRAFSHTFTQYSVWCKERDQPWGGWKENVIRTIIQTFTSAPEHTSNSAHHIQWALSLTAKYKSGVKVWACSCHTPGGSWCETLH